MAQHIMAVCVVCLLCARHLPCEQHFEGILKPASKSENKQLLYQKEVVFQETNLPHLSSIVSSRKNRILQDTEALDQEILDLYDKPKSRRKSNIQEKRHAQLRRKRRHSIANEGVLLPEITMRPEITKDFVRKIFAEYGQDDYTIHVGEFERMLKRLGLYKLIEEELTTSKSCIPDESLVLRVKPHTHIYHTHNEKNQCLRTNNSRSCGGTDADDTDHESEKNYTLNEYDIVNLCPVLLYQLASPLQQERLGCINNSLLPAINHYDEISFEDEKEEFIYVWVYAFISVLACGILGLVGVAIIPFMDSRYYKHIIQFLVSLAVGTMTGDALLHLLPHSLAGQSESNMIYKGLTCMGGIIFFYITEHGLTMISEWRKSIAKKDKKTSRAKVVRDPESSINNSVVGDKLCKSKYSSYPYCYDEIAMDTKNDVWLHLPNNTANNSSDKSNTLKKKNGMEIGSCSETNETAKSLLSQNNYTPISDINHLPDSNTISTNLDDTSIADGAGAGGGCEKDKPLVHNDTVTVILREHESSHHGHSHKHGHVHSPPESLSAVAWMIIMGDGLHNFTDGMAIGAAFAENIAGGFSTSLAVFCHELPHELGDFAILMKAGMSVKSAVYYNLLTGVLSFIGMIFGIVFGQSHDTAQWMFAAAAGLFIYIALVDMMPELSAAHKSLEQFALQILGMSSGVLLMLLIAIYEGDLMNVFSSPSAATSLGHHIH